MKSKLNPVPAAKRTEEKINNTKHDKVIIGLNEAQKLVTGIYELDAKVKLKDTQLVTITKQKSDLQQLVTAKTSEIQSKNSLLTQKEQLILQKEQLLSELRIREENQLKEEYISVLHQLNPKVYSANYEDWSGKAQGFKDIIDQGKFKTIRKKLPVYKQQLAQKIETEKLALATKEAEKLDKAKQEVVSILNQLHPTLYPANFEEWSTHHAAHNSTAKALLDSGNLEAIEKKLVHYRGLLKEEVQNKVQLILQKEQEFKSLNDTFTTTLSTKEEEIAKEKLKNTEVSHKVKKVSEKLAQEVQSKNQLALQKEMEEKLRIEKEQEIERLKEQLSQKEIETQELLARKELEKKELLDQKELELANKSLVKNQVIGDLQDDIGLKEKESYKLQIELLMKQVEFHKKESELKDKILEAAREIGKQKEINTELLDQNEVLDLKMQYATKEARVREIEKSILFTQKEKLSSLLTQKDYELNNALLQKEIEQKELLIQKEMELADKSLIKNQVIDQLREEIADLNKQLSQNNIAYSIYLDEVGCQPGSSLFEKQLLESLDLSSINLSPIDHGGQNQIVGNFDINHINTTHSIYPSGEGSSFDIIDVENSH